MHLLMFLKNDLELQEGPRLTRLNTTDYITNEHDGNNFITFRTKNTTCLSDDFPKLECFPILPKLLVKKTMIRKTKLAEQSVFT